MPAFRERFRDQIRPGTGSPPPAQFQSPRASLGRRRAVVRRSYWNIPHGLIERTRIRTRFACGYGSRVHIHHGIRGRTGPAMTSAPAKTARSRRSQTPTAGASAPTARPDETGPPSRMLVDPRRPHEWLIAHWEPSPYKPSLKGRPRYLPIRDWALSPGPASRSPGVVICWTSAGVSFWFCGNTGSQALKLPSPIEEARLAVRVAFPSRTDCTPIPLHELRLPITGILGLRGSFRDERHGRFAAVPSPVAPGGGPDLPAEPSCSDPADSRYTSVAGFLGALATLPRARPRRVARLPQAPSV